MHHSSNERGTPQDVSHWEEAKWGRRHSKIEFHWVWWFRFLKWIIFLFFFDKSAFNSLASLCNFFSDFISKHIPFASLFFEEILLNFGKAMLSSSLGLFRCKCYSKDDIWLIRNGRLEIKFNIIYIDNRFIGMKLLLDLLNMTHFRILSKICAHLLLVDICWTNLQNILRYIWMLHLMILIAKLYFLTLIISHQRRYQIKGSFKQKILW